jgi:phage regulator Rha-like protein
MSDMMDLPTSQQLEVGVTHTMVAELFGPERAGLARIIIHHPEDLNENAAAQHAQRHFSTSHFFLIDLRLEAHVGDHD